MSGGNSSPSRFDRYGQGTLPGMAREEVAAGRHLDPNFRVVRPVGRVGTLGAAANSVKETSEQIMDRIWAGTKDRIILPDPGDALPAVD